MQLYILWIKELKASNKHLFLSTLDSNLIENVSSEDTDLPGLVLLDPPEPPGGHHLLPGGTEGLVNHHQNVGVIFVQLVKHQAVQSYLLKFVGLHFCFAKPFKISKKPWFYLQFVRVLNLCEFP